VVEIDAQVPVPFLGRHQVLVGKSARGGLGNEHAMIMAMRAVMSDNMAFWFVAIVSVMTVSMGMRMNVGTRVR
jgi:hypothetical protein